LFQPAEGFRALLRFLAESTIGVEERDKGIDEDGMFCLDPEAFDIEGIEEGRGMVGFEEGRKPAGMAVEDAGELFQPDMGVVRWTHSEEGKRRVEAGGLVEEEGFNAGRVGAAAEQIRKRDTLSDGKKGVAVDRLAEAPGD